MEGLEPAILFESESCVTTPKRFLLPRWYALPSECCFLRFGLIVTPVSIKSAFWKVLRIDTIEPLPAFKEDLLNILKRMLRASDVDMLQQYLIDEPDLLDIKNTNNPRVHRVLEDLIGDALRAPNYYKLLRFFHAAVLNKLTEQEQERILLELHRDPRVFAHWSYMNSIPWLPEAFRVQLLSLKHPKFMDMLYDSHCALIHPALASALDMPLGDATDVVRQRFLASGHLLHPCKSQDVKLLSRYYWVSPAQDCFGTLIDCRNQAEIKLCLQTRSWQAIQTLTYARTRLDELTAAQWTIASAVPALQDEFGKLPTTPVKRLALLHIHKIGPSQLLYLLQHNQTCELLFIGDRHEMPAHSWAGGGDMFRDLCDAKPYLEWESDAPELIALKSRRLNTLSCSIAVTAEILHKIMMTWKNDIRKQQTSRRRANQATYVILCSTQNTKVLVNSLESEPLFKCGMRVHDLETDQLYMIKRAFRGKYEIPKKEVIEKGDLVTLASNDNELKQVIVGEFACESIQCSLSKLWVGPRVDHLLFVAEPTTTIDEMLGIFKYIKQSFAIVFTKEATLASLPIERERRSSLISYLLNSKNYRENDRLSGS